MLIGGGPRGGSFAGRTDRSNVAVVPNRRSWQSQDLAFWVPLNTSDLSLVDAANGIRPSSNAIFETAFWPEGLAGSLFGSTGPTFRAARPLKGPWALACWIRPGFASTDGTNHGIFELTTGSTNLSLSFLGVYPYWTVTMGSNIGLYATTPAFAADDLIHVVATGAYQGGFQTRQIWVNGTLSSNAGSDYYADPSAFDQSVWVLGSAINGTYNFTGSMLDVRAYNRTLTAGEIRELYDDSTRWELYDPAPRLWIPGVEASSAVLHTLSVSGSLTPTGAITKTTAHLTAGSVTPTGVLRRTGQKLATGSLTPAGALRKQALKSGLAGSLTPAGALTLVRAYLRTFTGAVTPSGALVRSFSKGLAGSLTPAGSLRKTDSKTIVGSLTPTGAVRKAANKTILGGITPAGALATVRAFVRTFTGSVTPAGTLARQTQKRVTGTITPTGTLGKLVAKVLAGQLVPAGVMTYIPPGGGGSGSNLQPYITVYFWKRTG